MVLCLQMAETYRTLFLRGEEIKMECAEMKRHVNRNLDCDGKGLIVKYGKAGQRKM